MKNIPQSKEELLAKVEELQKEINKAGKLWKDLQAANQQLAATEQQLRAMNQQLEANNQQLKENQIEINNNRTLLNATLESPQGMIVFALDRNYCYTIFTSLHKTVMKKIWDVDIEVGMNMLDVIKDENDRKKAKVNFDKALNGEHLVLVEEYGDQNLNRSYWENRYSPIYDENNMVIGVSVFVIDISSRIKAENEIRIANQQLREKENSLRALFNAMTDIVLELDYDGMYITIAPTSTKLLYKPTADLLGKSLHDVFPKDQADTFLALIRKSLDENKLEKIEYTLVINNKSYWFEGTITPKSKNTALFIARDITERKKFEKDLITAKEKAEESEERLLTFINSVPDIICYKDGEGKWLLANDADLDLFCLTGVDYFNKTDTELAEYTNEIYKDAFLNCVVTDEKAWQKKEKSNEVEKITTIDGTEKTFDIIKTPTFYPDGKRKGLSVIGRDITNLKEIEQSLLKRNLELIAAKEKAEESDRLKSAFLANMSHEIRTPMNGIIGFTSLLEEPDFSLEEKSEFIKKIQLSGERMLNTINDIVDISKIEAGLEELNYSVVSIKKLCNELLNFFTPEASSKGLTLNYKPFPGKEELTIVTDNDKLYRVLSNLIKNAIKYSDEGTITFGFRHKGKFIEFFVKDTGIGIPKNRHKAIFNRFEQADISDKRALQGSGLGLTISKEYIEMLGGTIAVISEKNIGSEFIFKLPLSIPKAAKRINKLNKEQEAKYKTKLTDKEILIVDDEDTSMLYLKTILKNQCKKTHLAYTGEEAIEICKKNPNIDIVLMDMKMPNMDGYTSTREIRKFNKKLIIIAQTAYAMKGDKEKAFKAGCNEYISKPINRVKLFDILKSTVK